MQIENNKMVSLTYELRENDSEGRVIETLDESRPLKFIYGTGKLLPVFESNISFVKDRRSISNSNLSQNWLTAIRERT